MMRFTICVAALLALGACVADETNAPPPPRAGDSKAPPAGQSKAPAPPARDPSDTCGAAELKYLVGRPKTEIPVPVNPKNRRVTCTTCPVTMDFSPVRLNIFFDQTSGIIREVKCG